MSEKPEPRPTPLDDPFWEGCREHRLLMQTCNDCGYVRWPPSPVCPECWSQESTWQELAGTGELVSWVTFHVPFLPSFEADLPYTVVEVELDEGPRYLGGLVDDVAVEELTQGLRMEATYVEQGDFVLPIFQPLVAGD